MQSGLSFVRQGFLAALLTFAGVGSWAWGEVTVHYDAANTEILIDGLSQTDRSFLMTRPENVDVKVANLAASRGMPVSVSSTHATLVIEPRFALQNGTQYSVTLALPAGLYQHELTLPKADHSVPQVLGFQPSQSVVPENTLRLYVTFSEPMARGFIRDGITLIKEDGTKVPSPFLTLGPELWDVTQTRVTLLFDPGRIKQGVGPNMTHGAPLVAGERYELVVSSSIPSARGVPLGKDVRLAFAVGAAEHRAVDPNAWHVLTPKATSHAPLSIVFDRIMDSGAARRFITVTDPNGHTLAGRIETDGGGWSFYPHDPWMAGVHHIHIDPELEDVAGNAIGKAFDAARGTIGKTETGVTLPVELTNL